MPARPTWMPRSIARVWLYVQALFSLVLARALLRLARRASIRWATTRAGGRVTADAAGVDTRVVASALAGAVAGVAPRRFVNATCLEQALGLVCLLALRRRPGGLAIGVRREHGSLRAHAWVECHGEVVLGGGPLLGRLARLPPASVRTFPSWSS
ncbi:MAG TPA: lasso peptide biosynthesis B2 protein [Vicinamibacterales bacterium]|nr:lasso peptide biosynthesis B2 protein [Vicinamibacterales bacterium]